MTKLVLYPSASELADRATASDPQNASPPAYNTATTDLFNHLTREACAGLFQTKWNADQFGSHQVRLLDELGYSWSVEQASPRSRPYVLISWGKQ